MKKQLSLLLLSTLFLTSCGGTSKVEETEVAKKEYTIETQNIENFSKDVTIEKFGKIEWSQDISVKTQVSWKVASINKKDGDKVLKWETIIALSDNIGNYGINVQRAKNALSKAQLSYQDTKNNFEKSIKDAELNLQKAKSSYENIKITSNQTVQQAQNNLSSNDLDDNGSEASLKIKKQEEDIAKATLDLQNTLNTNKESVESHKSNTKVQYNSFKKLYTDSINDLDIILWYSEENKSKNDAYEDNLGAKNKATFIDAFKSFETIYLNDGFDEINPRITSENDIITYLNKVQKGYEDMIELLDKVDLMFKNSTGLNTTLTEASAKASSIQGQFNSNYSAFVNYKNQTVTFLNTYKSKEESLKLSLDLQKSNLEIAKLSAQKVDNDTLINFNKTLSSSKDQLLQAEIAVKNAENSLEKLKKDKEIALKQSQTSINDASISLSEANKNYNNLFIKSPINGIISEVSVDIWEEINNGSPVFTVVSDKKQEVVVSLPQNELSFVTVGKDAKIEYNNNYIWATVTSIWAVADSNLNYKVKLSLNSPVSIIGGSVKVSFTTTGDKYLIPLNIVKINNGNKGIINTYTEENTFEEKDVVLGKIWGNEIELINEIPEGTRIIKTDLKNFDENKHTLVVKN